MSLDNALRSALLQEGEAIPADGAAALPGIHGRLRARRRRRLGEAVAAAVVVAAVVWVPPAVRVFERGPDVTPTERQRDPVDRHDPPAPRRVPAPGGSDARTGRTTSPARGTATVRPGRRATAPARTQPRGREEAPAPVHLPSPAMPRLITERYDVRYIAGTHVGENAGAGCPKGESATGANDCFPIQIAEGETRIAFRLVDDAGVPVGATVYHNANGESFEFTFCGRTGYRPVEPGANLLVYIDTSDRCSAERPRTGTLVARIR